MQQFQVLPVLLAGREAASAQHSQETKGKARRHSLLPWQAGRDEPRLCLPAQLPWRAEMAIRKWLIPLEEGKVRICDTKPVGWHGCKSPAAARTGISQRQRVAGKGEELCIPEQRKRGRRRQKRGKAPNLAQPHISAPTAAWGQGRGKSSRSWI